MFRKKRRSMLARGTRRVCGALLAACLLAAGLVPAFPAAGAPQEEDGQYALKMAAGSGYQFFGQLVSLSPDKTYVFSYQYTQGDTSYPQIFKGATETAVSSSLRTVYDEEYCQKSVTFIPPADAPDGSGGKQIWVGIRGGEASPRDQYYYRFRLYDTEDPDTNLLADSRWEEGGDKLNGDVWKSAWNLPLDAAFSKVTVESIGGADRFLRTDANRYALKMAAGAGYQYFGQFVSLSPEKTYVFSYQHTRGDTSYIQIIKSDKDDGAAYQLPVRTVYDEELLRKSASFTPPADAPDDPAVSGNKRIWVSFRGGEASSQDQYYYNFRLYDVENPDVNLFADPLLDEGGDALGSQWRSYWGTLDAAFSKVTLESIGGAKIFQRTDEDRYVLVGNVPGTGWPFIGQNVVLDPNKTYVFSYCYDGAVFPPGALFNGNNTEGTEGPEVTCRAIYDEDYKKVSYEFQPPADAQSAGDGLVKIYLGVRFPGHKGYLYDFQVYDKENPDVNLFDDYAWQEGGANVNFGKWIGAWGQTLSNTDFQKISLAQYKEEQGLEADEDPFQKTDADRYVVKLTPNAAGGPWFGQQVSLTPGKVYELSYYFLPGSNANLALYKDLNETSFSAMSITYDKEWSKITAVFTPPDDALNDPAVSGNKLVWVGFRGDYVDQELYFCNLSLCDTQEPSVNLLRDYALLGNSTEIDTSVWQSAYGDGVNTNQYTKVTLESVGGMETFRRTGNSNPKMMYYEKTDRGPNQEPYACFTLSFPDELNDTYKNYVFEFDARPTTGAMMDNFRCYNIVPELQSGADYTVKPVKIEGYRYTFHLRERPDAEGKFGFMFFVPDNSTGHISNIAMYEADENFQKLNDYNLISHVYGDFSQFDNVGDYVPLYTIQGACIGTETGRLDEMPAGYFDTPPDVPVPEGPKMMSYASLWGTGQLSIDLPYTVESGDADGKNYVVSFYLRPTAGRDPSKYYTSGLEGDLVQVYPVEVDGYKYTFHLTERYRFRLVLEIPASCEGYISRLEMYEADESFNIIGTENLADTFGQNGDFRDVVMQAGMSWPGISLSGGLSNTFVDTRELREELESGTLGDYHCTGALWPIPQGYLEAAKDEDWADGLEDDTGSEAQSGTVKGRLLDAQGNPLSGVRISLVSMQDASVVYEAVTGTDGSFVLENIPLGGYEVRITGPNGETQTGDGYVWVEEDGDVVTLTLTYDGDMTIITVPDTGDFPASLAVGTTAGLAALLAAASTLVLRKKSGSRRAG